MPNFTVLSGRIVKGSTLYEEGARISLDDDEAAPLLERGRIEPVRKGRPPSGNRGRRSAWTPGPDDDTDDGDDAEGGDD